MGIIDYREISTDELDLIKPLWEQLNDHHMNLSTDFKKTFQTRTFDDRKKSLLSSNKQLKIWIAEDVMIKKPIGYCISSVSGEEGEIDSIFVSDKYRGKNVGQELMNRSLAWFEQNGIVKIFISVLYGNENALHFYEKFGFAPRTYRLMRRC